jgi:glutamate dehydrogenase/leucine dehydrogenase
MVTSPFDFCDDLGPAKVLHVYEPRSGLRSIVVIDNVACGPAIGGVRMASDVSVEEVFRLARAMTLKNAAAGLPHGGGKSGIVADPAQPEDRREELVRAFAAGIRDLVDYIPGPDMGTDETCMAWVHDTMGRAVGLPRVLGGIPLDEIGATAYGLAQCAEVANELGVIELDGARVAIEGFGNVGRPAARFLEERGARLVAASDSKGAVHIPDGVPSAELERVKAERGTVAAFEGGETIPIEDLLTVPCDILVPAARPDSIHDNNVDRIQARLVLQGANIPATASAEQRLHERGITVVPDFIANAGGVICGSVEYHGGTESAAMAQIAEKIRANTRAVLERSRESGLLPRQAAIELAESRVRRAMQLRR